ncbi:hypothetical protein BGW38_005923 [Lunasporangiospora selenospora]|uniref:Chromo domain-containing protein n=1 Tax=Lunasporangiospora selenospora TaxID=979761 RepID=A0A9P6G1D1_9FUNG|nr:hypothetical protein BGW38_005923 [Lunasporangiospora selenospora]
MTLRQSIVKKIQALQSQSSQAQSDNMSDSDFENDSNRNISAENLSDGSDLPTPGELTSSSPSAAKEQSLNKSSIDATTNPTLAAIASTETVSELGAPKAGRFKRTGYIKSKKAQEHIRGVLEVALPEGSHVTDDTLERLSHLYAALVQDASNAAVNAAVLKISKLPSSVGQAERSHFKPAQAKKTRPAVASAPVSKISHVGRGKGSSLKAASAFRKRAAGRKDEDVAMSDVNDGEDSDTPMEEEFEVESIVGHKLVRGKQMFRVKWVGYPKNQNTWQEKSSLSGCKDILDGYISENKLTL